MSNSKEARIETSGNYTKRMVGNLSVYQLKLRDTGRENFNKKEFGSPSKSKTKTKTIMVLGATGSGKTTLINGMINYIMGVEWVDPYRFKLIDEQTSRSQAESQTSKVTAYQLHHQDHFKVDYSVTIIDTPGFGDTRGISQDKKIMENIRQFFSMEDGILELDAVCFVVQSALARLTQTQKYIFEAIFSIFGKDIENNIVIMINFADGQRPPVLQAIEAAKIPCEKTDNGTPLYFAFNNSALFAQNSVDDEDSFDEMFWKLGKKSMNRFFNHLDTMETKSLQLTKEVLTERKELEAVVSGLLPLFQSCLGKLEQIKNIKETLEKKQHVMKENENFEYEVDIINVKKVNMNQGKFAKNCSRCNFTCHSPCKIRKKADKNRCAAMRNGKCKVCPGRCPWSAHQNKSFRLVTTIVKEKRTYAYLKVQFEEALGEKMTIEKMIRQLEKEYSDVEDEAMALTNKLAKRLTRLNEIALHPDPLSTPDYIDLLIEAEKSACKEGHVQRIAQLLEIKKKAQIVQMVKKRKPQESKTGVFNDMKNWFQNLVD